MKLPHTFYSLLALLCVLLLNTGSAVADLSSDAETLFEWAEENYPEYFPPPGASTQFLDPWLYRYYPATDIYSGVNSNSEVWVLGDIFGGLLYISTVEELLDIVTESQTPVVEQNNGIDFNVMPVVGKNRVVEITWNVSSNTINSGGREFTIQLYVGGAQQWLDQVTTSETSDWGFPVFLGGVPNDYCFRMIATETGSTYNTTIHGSGISGNKAPCI